LGVHRLRVPFVSWGILIIKVTIGVLEHAQLLRWSPKLTIFFFDLQRIIHFLL
jgi:hypothetical protein